MGSDPIQSWLAARFEDVVGAPYHSGRDAFEALDENQRVGLIEEERVAAVADVQCSIPLEDEWNRIGVELEARYLSEYPELVE